jgi:molybdenum cofactor sulfurtransferase
VRTNAAFEQLPIGLGALLVRKDVLPLMQKKFYGGGTIRAATIESRILYPYRETGSHVPFEDGTLNFYGVLALKHGFTALQRIGGMSQIEMYCNRLMTYAKEALMALKYDNHKPMCKLYVSDSELQGPTVSFNMFTANNAPIGFKTVAERCAKNFFQVPQNLIHFYLYLRVLNV